MAIIVKIMNEEFGLEREVTKTHEIVTLTKPTLHIEVCQTTESGLRKETFGSSRGR